MSSYIIHNAKTAREFCPSAPRYQISSCILDHAECPCSIHKNGNSNHQAGHSTSLSRSPWLHTMVPGWCNIVWHVLANIIYSCT